MNITLVSTSKFITAERATVLLDERICSADACGRVVSVRYPDGSSKLIHMDSREASEAFVEDGVKNRGWKRTYYTLQEARGLILQHAKDERFQPQAKTRVAGLFHMEVDYLTMQELAEEGLLRSESYVYYVNV